MNINYITASIAATLAFASCSNDSIIETTGSDEIRYEITNSSVTRASKLHNPGDKVDFCISATVNDDKINSANFTTYFSNDKVTYATDGTETYAGGEYKRYWPDGKSLNFYAIHGCGSSINLASLNYANLNYANSATVLNDLSYQGSNDACGTDITQHPLYNKLVYKIPNVTITIDSTKEDDILYAYAAGKSLTNCQDGVVPLNFRHAFAKVDFVIQNKAKNLYVEVQTLYVVPYWQNGNLYFGTDDTSEQYTTNGTNSYSYSSNCWWGRLSPSKLSKFYWKDDYTNYFGYYNTDNCNYENLVIDADPNPSGKRSFMMIPQPLGVYIARNSYSYASSYNYVCLQCKVYNVAEPDVFKTKLAEINTQYDDAIAALTGESAKEAKYYEKFAAIHNILQTYAFPIIGDFSSWGAIYFPLEADSSVNPNGWEAGKHYTYKIVFGGSGTGAGKDDSDTDILTPVSLNLTVDDWGISTKDVNVVL